MKFKVLVDMNLSPQWVDFLEKHSIGALHWSAIGDHKAKDQTIMRWAQEHRYIVFTNDLDFGSLLVLTRADLPSVIQMRTPNVLPEYWGNKLSGLLRNMLPNLRMGH